MKKSINDRIRGTLLLKARKELFNFLKKTDFNAVKSEEITDTVSSYSVKWDKIEKEKKLHSFYLCKY